MFAPVEEEEEEVEEGEEEEVEEVEGGSNEALSIVRQQQRRPTRSLQDARNCQLFPDNSSLLVVFFNRCNPANYDGGRLAVENIFYRSL